MMQVEKLEVDRSKAKELHALYHAHRKDETEMDAEIRRAYREIGQGRMVIQALASITAAGVKEDGSGPKLAIVNATAPRCHLTWRTTGEMTMRHAERFNHRDRTNVFRWPAGTLPYERQNRPPLSPYADFSRERVAMTPIIPIHLRPKKNLASYHILFEAEWSCVPPVDPMLLRRLTGDMWLVVAVWDLTPVERAAMAHRVSA